MEPYCSTLVLKHIPVCNQFQTINALSLSYCSVLYVWYHQAIFIPSQYTCICSFSQLHLTSNIEILSSSSLFHKFFRFYLNLFVVLMWMLCRKHAIKIEKFGFFVFLIKCGLKENMYEYQVKCFIVVYSS